MVIYNMDIVKIAEWALQVSFSFFYISASFRLQANFSKFLQIFVLAFVK